MQCRPNVFDVGPTSHKCYTNVLCLSGIPLLVLAHVECCCPSAAHVFHASHIALLPCSCCSAFSSKLLTMSLLVLAQLYALLLTLLFWLYTMPVAPMLTASPFLVVGCFIPLLMVSSLLLTSVYSPAGAGGPFWLLLWRSVTLLSHTIPCDFSDLDSTPLCCSMNQCKRRSCSSPNQTLNHDTADAVYWPSVATKKTVYLPNIYPTNTRHWRNVNPAKNGSLTLYWLNKHGSLTRCLPSEREILTRCWPNKHRTLTQCWPSQTRDIDQMLSQRWTSVVDGGSKLYRACSERANLFERDSNLVSLALLLN